MRKLIAVFLIGASALAAAPGRAAVIESRTYVALAGDATNLCPELLNAALPGLAGVGGGCFRLSNVSHVAVVVGDMLAPAVGFRVGFYGPAGLIGETIDACDDASLDVPATANTMRVFVLSALEGCTAPMTLPTVGTISVVR